MWKLKSARILISTVDKPNRLQMLKKRELWVSRFGYLWKICERNFELGIIAKHDTQNAFENYASFYRFKLTAVPSILSEVWIAFELNS